MKVAIIKYNAGNTASVVNALRRVGVDPCLTDDRETILAADKVIFPGVGEASTAMRYLKDTGLDEAIRSLRQPFLGICLGMQLLCKATEENDTECLGIIPLRVRRFAAAGLKVPQIGWNCIFDARSPLFQGLGPRPYLYFVHSYYVETGPETISLANYGSDFSAAVQYKNFFAVQFHPERSGADGRRIIANFLDL